MKAICQTIWKVFDSAWFVIFFILLILVGRSCEGNWYSGIIHIHSTFSDGDRTPAMLKNAAAKMGCKFLIVTDHFEQIDKEKKGLPRADLFTRDFGFDKYWNDFSVNQPILCLPGVEITSSDGSHTLGIANNVSAYQQELNGNQENILKVLSNARITTIAAHPSLKKFWYNRDCTYGLYGIEFFNETSDNYKDTLAMYLDLISQDRTMFVTAGCDSHSSAEPTDVFRWRRQTMVWMAGELTKKSLMLALPLGQTYAANNGAYFKSINYLPGRKEQKVGVPIFKLEIGFTARTVASKTVRIYRDGKLVNGSVKVFPALKQKYSYQWEDKDANQDRHIYIIEVEGCLVTSPIYLDVKGSKSVSPKVTVRTVSSSAASSRLYKDSIDEPIKENLARLWQAKEKSTHLVITKEDQDYIRNYDADRRVLMALLELAETHTLAIRMKIGYQNEKCWISRETAPSKEMPNISAHFTAQAYDIFCADGVEIAWQVSSDLTKRTKAHQKIRQLIREIIAIGRKDSNLLPTQMMIYSWDDVNVFLGDLNKFYGPVSQRGNSGMWANDRMWDRIHIGY